MECLYEGASSCLDNIDKGGFYVYSIHAHPLEYLLEETLGGKCLFHHGYMRKLSGLRPMSTSFIAIAIKTW